MVCCVQISLQQHGLTDWSIQLLSIATVVPSSIAQSLPCQARWGKFCLDGTIWTPAALTMIACFGGFTVLVIAFALLIMREVQRRSGVVRAPSLRMRSAWCAHVTLVDGCTAQQLGAALLTVLLPKHAFRFAACLWGTQYKLTSSNPQRAT